MKVDFNFDMQEASASDVWRESSPPCSKEDIQGILTFVKAQRGEDWRQIIVDGLRRKEV